MTQCFVPTMCMGFIIIRNYYELFYAFHPSMFVFLDNKVKLQATTCIKLGSTHAAAVRRRYVSEKETFAV